MRQATGRAGRLRRPVLGGAAVALVLVAAAATFGAENFPPPEFSRPYQFPAPTTPSPRATTFAYVDMAVLLVALVLAAYLALRARSRQGLVGLAVFSLFYFGFYRQGCICSVGSIQNVALAAANGQYALPLVAGVFFILPLLFALFFGRVFCASVCPLGVVQEIVLLRPVKVRPWLDSALGLIPYLYLGFGVLFAAIGSRFVICEADPFIVFYRRGGPMWVVLFGVGMLVLSTFVGRPYCRYLCPYGALLRLVAPLSQWKLRITPGECINCHLCADACPYGAIKAPNAESTAAQKAESRRRLRWLLVGLPFMVGFGAWALHAAAPTLAGVHPTVRLAVRVWQEERGLVQGKTDESEAFDKLGIPAAELHRQALDIHGQFARWSWVLGAWLGLAFGIRMISLSVLRHRREYQIDMAACVACGRCYSACPVGREQALSEDLSESGIG